MHLCTKYDVSVGSKKLIYLETKKRIVALPQRKKIREPTASHRRGFRARDDTDLSKSPCRTSSRWWRHCAAVLFPLDEGY
jgi:hypothetical protein